MDNVLNEVVYRPLRLFPELQSAVELQKYVWNKETITSAPQMRAALLHGGSAIGAFADRQLIGFCYGFPGYDGKKAFLASHMMVIHPDYRDQGIGMHLKCHQREWAIQHGYSKIKWTYDPFETRNAYLNLCKLAGQASSYIEAFYGEDDSGLPTDRFVVEWDLQSTRVLDAIGNSTQIHGNWSHFPVLLRYEPPERIMRTPEARNIGTSPGYLIPIPSDIKSLKIQQPELVKLWQICLRKLCAEAFDNTYHAVGLIRQDGPIHYYVFEKEPSEKMDHLKGGNDDAN